jgi:ribonuclease-3
MAGNSGEARPELAELMAALAHTFARPELLVRALTHPSYAHEEAHVESDNQRLEFLGDAVLGLLIARRLFERYPDLPEGRLSRIKAALVCEDTLAAVAEDLHVGGHLLLGKGEQASGGGSKASILADAVEALFAAVYLDGGYEAAERVVDHLFGHRFEEARRGYLVFDSKTALQELIQSQGDDRPVYRVTHQEGPAHDRTFVVQVSIGGAVVAEGSGHSKKEAEKRAASAALAHLIDAAAGGADDASGSAGDG